MRICRISGKKTITGNNISHSNRATKRIWKPNLQKVTVIIDGQKKKIRVCARYIRKIKNGQM